MEITNGRLDIVRHQLIALNGAAKNVTNTIKIVIVKEKYDATHYCHNRYKNITVRNFSTVRHCTKSHQKKK